MPFWALPPRGAVVASIEIEIPARTPSVVLAGRREAKTHGGAGWGTRALPGNARTPGDAHYTRRGRATANGVVARRSGECWARSCQGPQDDVHCARAAVAKRRSRLEHQLVRAVGYSCVGGVKAYRR